MPDRLVGEDDNYEYYYVYEEETDDVGGQPAAVDSQLIEQQ